MKASILQLVSSSVVLGLMVGAVGFHWHQVNRWNGQSAGEPAGAAFVRVDTQRGSVPVSWIGSEVEESPAMVSAGAGPEMGATVEALNEIVSVLRELKDENHDLREQVKEANRDLTEMQFRLDTHSKSFRPLHPQSDRATPLRNPADNGSSHPLLPPKRRN